MKGLIDNLIIDKTECVIYLPPKYFITNKTYPVVYMNGEEEIDETIIDYLESKFNLEIEEFIMVGIKSNNWNDDFTPWPAKSLSKKTDSFNGEALNYIRFIENNLKPFIDKNYKTKKDPSNTAIIGYSLGGLVSLYSIYISKIFGKIGTLSASLWYDGWIEFMNKNTPLNKSIKIYMSLGKKEELNRNKRMASVGECTRETNLILKNQIFFKDNIVLEWNEGGHFTDVSDRFKKALLWLMSNDNYTK